MMDITGKLIDGVVSLTKLMAHGAMHEACLIEVIKTTEDRAFELVHKIATCVYGNDTYVQEQLDKYLNENNATVLDIGGKVGHEGKSNEEIGKKLSNKTEKIDKTDVNEILRKMFNDNGDILETDLKEKLQKLQEASSANNLISNDV